MKILRRKWHGLDRASRFRLFPLGDVHLGNAACDEKLFRSVVNRIAEDDSAYWVGIGDYADFVNASDPRMDFASLASWVKLSDIVDLARAQRDRFLDIIEPIAHKCLGMVEGNHERAITKYYERNIYLELVTGVKQRGGFPPEHQLAFGYSGWLMLHFYRHATRDAQGRMIRISLHHGFVGGKLAGAKALNMQRWLWSHDCDLAIFGHSHNSMVQVEAVERVKGNRVVHDARVGMYAGTFMNGARYSEKAGYFPLPLTQPHILLHPGAHDRREHVRVVA